MYTISWYFFMLSTLKIVRIYAWFTYIHEKELKKKIRYVLIFKTKKYHCRVYGLFWSQRIKKKKIYRMLELKWIIKKGRVNRIYQLRFLKKSGHKFKIEIKDQIKMHVEKVHVNYRVTVLPTVNVKLVSAIMRETIFVITLNNEQLFRPFI